MSILPDLSSGVDRIKEPPAARPPLVFRVATAADHEGIERLNHDTFAGEIPQHAPTDTGRLPDRFEADMTYVVAVEGDRVVGMIGVTGRRPFSLDHKLPDLDTHLPPAGAICELRLLAIQPSRRGGMLLRGLGACLAEVCAERGYDLAVISGTTRQLRLYRHLGFEPFGPLVGTPEAPYQPMYLTLDRFRPHADTFGQSGYGQGAAFRNPGRRVEIGRNRARAEKGGPAETPANFLPGPVTLRPAVRAAFAERPVSHRSAGFAAELTEVRRRLCVLTKAAHVQVLVGSGTLANDVIAGQVRRLGTPGVVLVCGEFGERLADHATRWGLVHTVARRPWGTSFGPAEVAAVLEGVPEGGWLWTPLCETSTGALLDLAMLKAACAEKGVHLVLDAVSAIGSVAVDLSGVRFASGTSGKGLGGPAGLALVFHDGPVAPAPDLPRYLDLGLYAQDGGVAFTHSSPLVRALGTALATGADLVHFSRVAADGARLRADLKAAHLQVLMDAADASPAVTTVVLPEGMTAEAVGRAMRRAGYDLAFESGYLKARGWVQICLMGDYARDRIAGLVETLAGIVHSSER